MKSRTAGAPAQAIAAPLLVRREHGIVVVLCFLAALRVFLFSAAFPFFNNVDEQSHFDLVHKYARGHIPADLERRDADAATIITLYETPEYFFKPGEYREGLPPRYRWPASDAAQAELQRKLGTSKAKLNFESTQPPLYYVVAGFWYRLGQWIGLSGGHALYWTRFLNVVLCGLLTLLAYRVARTCFPESSFLRLGVPILVAFFPQDTFYSVNNDVLLPLATGAAFWCLIFISRGVPKSVAFHAGTGLLVAAAILVKYSSVALLPVSAVMVVLGILRLPNAGEKKAAIAKAAVLLTAAAVPIGAWCARSYLLSGDLTGSLGKAHFLKWTLKPLATMFDHPIFSFSGMATFWNGTLVRFWRGEFVWELKPIASEGWDRFYSASSIAFLAFAMIATWTRRRAAPERQREVLWLSLGLFMLSLVFLATISVMYDFGDCVYPSRESPYLVSGRLALGSLIPFAALYVSGLDALLPRRLATPIRFIVLIGPVAWMTVSEFLMSGVAFRSAYNWFHIF